MIDAKRLLADLKRLRKRLDDELRLHHAASASRSAVRVEWQAALDARRTADTFETFWTAALDQAAVHWVLALVFLRFLEDNRLLDRPLLAGAGEQGELATERQRAYFRARPHDSDAEYLLDTLAEAGRLPGLSGLFDPAHNPLFALPISGDGAMALLAFFRARADSGELVHDFTDPDWGTRFLGDLYQDLSDDARKRFALLQTPNFVESWILDRTLEPAVGEFGYDRVRMIDPACGSGHFLLGGFARLLALHQRHAPDLPPAAQAQLALDAVSGVDLNPFAVEIARFRLLLAALRAAGETRLASAPDFRFSLAVGDSLFHGTHFSRGELGDPGTGFGRQLRHHYATEDTGPLETILRRQYHAVVGNPPYITPKDAAMRDAYREIYDSCHMKYGLGAPFTERFFDLAQAGKADQAAGFVGLIVANSFMKREFGAKLIEQVLPRLDLTHVVDCSGAYIPGHGTPTVVLFGRNRVPAETMVRTVRGIRGEPGAPEDPAQGLVWSAILAQTDQDASTSTFISTEDTPRAVLAQHPWNMGGGGAGYVQATIQDGRPVLKEFAAAVGVFGMTNADEVMLADAASFQRMDCEATAIRPLVVGDACRDWRVISSDPVLFPYAQGRLIPLSELHGVMRWLWPTRTALGNRATFSQRTYFDEGRPWWEWHQIAIERLGGFTITFGEVATHNHFVLDRGGKVFKQTAPVIKLAPGTSEEDHLGLLGLLNSSAACFWLKQVCSNKAAPGGGSANDEAWRSSFAFNGSNVSNIPITAPQPVEFARALDTQAQRLSENVSAAVCTRVIPSTATLAAAREEAESARTTMIALQEELDWRCYRLYGLVEDAPEHPDPPPLRLGERAFEIVMARKMAAGMLDTTWFTRHRSTPITVPPAHWPEDYCATVERRMALIESNPTISLIERPEYKRRWATQPWEDQERDALRTWLLDRLEDPRYWPAENKQLTSTRDLADMARRDPDFVAVAGLYAATEAFDLDTLVADLVGKEAVPFLAAQRYSETGLRKRADWEATWDKQREEDAIDAELASERDTLLRAAWARSNAREADEPTEAYAFRMAAGLNHPAIQQAADAAIGAQAKARKKDEVGVIPVPPKYRTPDFLHVDFWRLRGGLDVPKERFVSFPHCARDADGSLPVLWAGHDHLARAGSIAAWYVERKDVNGWTASRLAPLLAGLLELVPWLRQWHNQVDGESGLRMGDYYADFIADEAREIGLTLDELRAWTPPTPLRRTRGAATKRKTAA